MQHYNIIVAYDIKHGIGLNNDLPWTLPSDLKRFQQITSQPTKNCVIMGRKTWQSIPPKFRPLKNRINIILTTNETYGSQLYADDNVHVYQSFDELDRKIVKLGIDECFIIGGAEIYNQAVQRYNINKYYLTEVLQDFNCDTQIQSFDLFGYQLISSSINTERGLAYRFLDYALEDPNDKDSGQNEEQAYLDLMSKILTNGTIRPDRTGVGTISLFGGHLEFDISQRFPLLTTKSTFFRGLAEELFLFLSGLTDVKILQNKNVHIWDGNSSREYLDSIGQPHRSEGDLGKFYGFQWRHWGADYVDCTQDYTGKGFDQIQMVVDLIKNNPQSRRIILSAWNPADLKETVLPPCFTEKNSVLTHRGYKQISKVLDTDLLYTHNGNFKKVTKKYVTSYHGDIYKLSVKYHPHDIEATPNHPFYCKKVIYRSNNKLHAPENTNPDWIEAKDMSTDHYAGMKINDNCKLPTFFIKKSKKQNKYYTKTVTDLEEWYMMGYFLGDGWARWDRYTEFHMFFNTKDVDDLLPMFKKIVGNASLKKGYQKNCVVYNFSSRIWTTILKKFAHKAHNKIIPEWVHDAPKNYIEKFLEGYIRADGCHMEKNSNKYINFTTTSKNIALSLQRLYLKLGHFAMVRFQKRPKKFIIKGREVNQRDTYTIEIFPERKRQIRAFIENGFAWYPIEKIEKFNTNTDVYNFDVEDDHTYVVENCVVHNCHVLYQFYVNLQENTLSCHMYQR